MTYEALHRTLDTFPVEVSFQFSLIHNQNN